jgi:putative ABC transport system ATP-binding protein
MMSFIQFEDVYKSYHLGKLFVPALSGVSFAIEQGEFITLMGPSGSGKTTLLNLLGLIDTPDQGRILLNYQIIPFNKEQLLTKIRRQSIGFIFQSFNLIPILNVKENVEYPLLNSSLPLSVREQRSNKLLSMVGLAGLEKRFPHELSGGQRQRVAIARALVHSPSVVLADEPTANLDSETGSMIVDLMRRMNREEKVTFILATHDPSIISHADRVLKIRDGKLVNKS